FYPRSLHLHSFPTRRSSDLVRGVHPFNVEGGICLGVTQPLGFSQHRIERQPARLHFAQDEVGRSIDDAGDPVDAVRSKAFAHRLDRKSTRLNSSHVKISYAV